jgi:uncharacterized OB-fold protein
MTPISKILKKKVPASLLIQYTKKRSMVGVRCEKCSHIWTPYRLLMPRICPHCKTKKWTSHQTSCSDSFTDISTAENTLS